MGYARCDGWHLANVAFGFFFFAAELGGIHGMCDISRSHGGEITESRFYHSRHIRVANRISRAAPPFPMGVRCSRLWLQAVPTPVGNVKRPGHNVADGGPVYCHDTANACGHRISEATSS
eukprot:gb/GEZJ01000847.1/.p2 GENE.gb/GEZJ01000847.1/~~gb/GEZJ01000847.1/.p2  ORF type:complete len:120 (-),score=3.59 gb/GEZJ01000847.1/:1077-1436(-)